ncbi:hypothetical protein [Clostridium haemolyticum]|uniref:hypothetical protein n=1 Tax=Clostridium haemolyticum TaxID=84025 RepID=UPI001FA832FA|nr:hypothetical protein [Clostridium haemolyticum]
MKVKGVDAGYCRQPMKRLTEEKVKFAQELAKNFIEFIYNKRSVIDAKKIKVN